MSDRTAGGISTRTFFIAVMVLTVIAVTGGSLFALRQRLRSQVRTNIAADLNRSVSTFSDVEQRHQEARKRENALLADLPSLKALLTTNDERTITDGGVEFWKISGNNLFALLSKDGEVKALYRDGAAPSEVLRTQVASLIRNPQMQYFVGDGELYEYAVQPVYFGNAVTGTLLGYVVIGDAIDTSMLRQISRPTMADLIFLSGNQSVAQTLSSPAPENIDRTATTPAEIRINGQRYLAVARDLSPLSVAPLHLILLKSLREAEKNESEINRTVLLVGLISMLIGAGVMTIAAASMTAPLERLARSVRAFGKGDNRTDLPHGGTRELRLLSDEFAQMRWQIRAANEALIESERLATIGRMASSVSHDLRHYLAAVYANAEFLAAADLPPAERTELYEEITAAIKGTTELLDSLLIFSRTGHLQRTAIPLSGPIKRAIVLAEAHPDAQGVQLTTRLLNEEDCIVSAEGKQVERAVFNLLLNAIQAARLAKDTPAVAIHMEQTGDTITVHIADNGPGIPTNVRDRMFEPFVSEGKQKGTGLGLTLTLAIAQEHGGTVTLEGSTPGATSFAIVFPAEVHRPVLQEEPA